MMDEQDVNRQLKDSTTAVETLKPNEILEFSNFLVDCLRTGGKILLCGNGGSAADAQHIAGELVGRFKRERAALPALSLSTDTSILTALPNDYDFNIVFSRQVEALGQSGDILFCLSTSGDSVNLVNACIAAKEQDMKVVALTGFGGGEIKQFCDCIIEVESNDTPRIQEAHAVCYHIICDFIEQELFK